MNANNITEQSKKYFYTVLFLNNYYPKKPEPIPGRTETKVFDICNDTNTTNIKWLDENTLWIRHNMKLPLTLEMWDAQGNPIFYCPILKDDIDSLSLGDIIKESDTSLKLNFESIAKPADNEVFKLAMRTLPMFDLKNQVYTLPQLPLDEQIEQNITGLAIVFRRNSLDALFDLFAEFDESYWHTLEETYDLQYLTRMSCYKDCFFAGKYTNNLQDILDLINTSKYEIKYSWDNVKEGANPIYL